MSQQAGDPVVRVAVNEHLRQVASRSTYRFDFSGVADNSMKVIDEPVSVEYAGDAGSGFVLSPAGFVAISQSGGWVYDVTIAMPRRAEPLPEAYQTAVTVDSLLSRTTWRRTGEPLPNLERIRRDLADPVTGSSGNRGLGSWMLGTAELNVTLKRTARRGDRTSIPGRREANDRYVIEVEIYDGAHLDAYEKRTYNIRRARQHGDASRALPLNAILDDPTPVTNGIPSRTPPR